MLSSIQPSASHASPPPPLGLTVRELRNEAISPSNPNKLQPLMPSRDEAATSQPDAPALRRFSLRPLPLGEAHSCAAFPSTANHVEQFTKRSHFPSQPEQTETICTLPSRSHLPQQSFPRRWPAQTNERQHQGGQACTDPLIGIAAKSGQGCPSFCPSGRRLESRRQPGMATLPRDFRHARHAGKIAALEERRRGAQIQI